MNLKTVMLVCRWIVIHHGNFIKNHLLDSGFKHEAVEEIEKATIALLKRLNRDTADTGSIKGLVIGYVQSGKTANMAALMAMAADWGWNFFCCFIRYNREFKKTDSE